VAADPEILPSQPVREDLIASGIAEISKGGIARGQLHPRGPPCASAKAVAEAGAPAVVQPRWSPP